MKKIEIYRTEFLLHHKISRYQNLRNVAKVLLKEKQSLKNGNIIKTECSKLMSDKSSFGVLNKYRTHPKKMKQ